MKHANTDAKTRASRTLVQGLLVTVILAIAGVIIQVIGEWTHTDFLNGESWTLFIFAVVQAALTAGASWAQRTIESKADES